MAFIFYILFLKLLYFFISIKIMHVQIAIILQDLQQKIIVFASCFHSKPPSSETTIFNIFHFFSFYGITSFVFIN